MIPSQELTDNPSPYCLMARNIMTPLGSAVLIKYTNALRSSKCIQIFVCLQFDVIVFYFGPPIAQKKKQPLVKLLISSKSLHEGIVAW